MLEDKIRKMLNEKQWTFADLQEVSTIVDNFADRLYTEMTAKEKLDLVWERSIQPQGISFGALFQITVMDEISQDIAISMKDIMMTANINFNGEDKNEVSERSLGRESPKERPSDETSDIEE